MWEKLLDVALRATVKTGTLTLKTPGGQTFTYGDGTGEPVGLIVTRPDAVRRLALNPELAVGECYMDEGLVIENDDLHGMIRIALENRTAGEGSWFMHLNRMLRQAGRRVQQKNPVGRARSNVAHHYDLSAELYDLFLDADKQYSCAYFRDADVSLEQAQIDKKAHIAGKLRIEPGMRILDIGCGWGGMGLTLARDYGAEVVGVTLSEEQHKIARERAAAAGLADRVDFRLTDYRDVDEKFDRIVSVGMFEHVGVPHYREYFSHLHDKLTPDGVALIHTIGRRTPPGTTSPWIAKYIFPGGYVPAMSETIAAVEKEGLWCTDVEVWRLHYAETLKHWYDRFMDRIDEARELYDDRFCRMWRFYLVGSEQTFRHGGQCVFQFQLSRDQEAVPLTRDYLYAQPEEGKGLEAAE